MHKNQRNLDQIMQDCDNLDANPSLFSKEEEAGITRRTRKVRFYTKDEMKLSFEAGENQAYENVHARIVIDFETFIKTLE